MGRIIIVSWRICQRNPPNSGVGSDSKDQLVRAEALMTFARSKKGHPRNNRGNLKRALFSAKKKRRLTRVNADHVPAYAKPFLLPVLREAKLTPRHFSQYPIPSSTHHRSIQTAKESNYDARRDSRLNVLILVCEHKLKNCNNNTEI